MVNKSKNQTKQGQTHRPKKISSKPADNFVSTNLEAVTSNLKPKKDMTYIDQLTQIITKNSIAVTKSNSLQLAQDKTQEQFKSSKLDYAKESECAFVDTIDYFINKFVPDVTKKLVTENSAQPVKRSDQNHFNRKERACSSQNIRSMLTDLMIQQKEFNTNNYIFQKFKPDKNQLKQKFLKFPIQTENSDNDLTVLQSNRYNTSASANEQSNCSDSECSTKTYKKKKEANKDKNSVRHVCPYEQCQKEYNTKGKLAFHMRTKHNAENLSTSSSANEEYYRESLKIIIPDIAISNFATPRSQLPKEENMQLILEKQTGKNEIEKKEEVREAKMTKKDSFETQSLPLAQANFEKICHPYVEPSAVPDEEQIRIEKDYTAQPLSQSRKSSFLNQSIFIENNERRTEERIIEEIIRDFDNHVSEGLAKRHSIFFGFDDLDLFTPEIILSSN